MTVSTVPASSSSSPRPQRGRAVGGRPRGEGQWALGHREPLNPNERSKKDDNPLNVRARIESIYAHRGFASIDPADLGSPIAGVAETEMIDPTEAITEINRRFVGDPSLSNLPRKFKSTISWLADTPYEANDISFVGVIHPDHGPGFDLWVGGGLSTNPRLAERLGAWVPMHEVPEVWKGVVEVFRDYGYRRLRHRARLKFLLADWGADKFREVLEKEYLKRPLIDGPAPELPDKPIDHVGVHKQWDGKFYVGVAPVAGRVSGTLLARLADVVEAHGSGRVRITPYQKLLVLDVAEAWVPSLVAALRGIGLESDPSPWRRNT